MIVYKPNSPLGELGLMIRKKSLFLTRVQNKMLRRFVPALFAWENRGAVRVVVTRERGGDEKHLPPPSSCDADKRDGLVHALVVVREHTSKGVLRG